MNTGGIDSRQISFRMLYPKHFVGQALLIHSPPEIMLLGVDSDEHLIDEECVPIATVLFLQSAYVEGAELDTPKADRFSADRDASFSHKIFDIAMAQVEAIVEPDSIGNDIWRESVPFVGIHGPRLPIPTT